MREADSGRDRTPPPTAAALRLGLCCTMCRDDRLLAVVEDGGEYVIIHSWNHKQLFMTHTYPHGTDAAETAPRLGNLDRSKVGWNLEAPKCVPCAAQVELYWCVRREYTMPGHDQALNHPLHVLEGSCGSVHEAKKSHFSEEVGLSILVFGRTL